MAPQKDTDALIHSVLRRPCPTVLARGPGAPSPCCPLSGEPAGPAWRQGHLPRVSLSRKLKGWWQKVRLRSRKRQAGAAVAAGRAPWEADYELLPCEGLFDEYLEMGRSHVSGHGHASTVGRLGQSHHSRGFQPHLPRSASTLTRDVPVAVGTEGPAENPKGNCGGQSGQHPRKAGRGGEGASAMGTGVRRRPGGN